MNLNIALLHYPVTDKNGLTVATSITNFDIHDIARTARTYGMNRYYIVTPIESQIWLAGRIINHWQEGFGADYNPTRKEAFKNVRLKTDISEVIEDIRSKSDRKLYLVATSAKQHPNSVSFGELRKKIKLSKNAEFCILFGTGWGLHPEIMKEVDYILEPIYGPTEYNHLSVRSAVAIILDRLVGRK